MRREMREELGIELVDLRFVGRVEIGRSHKTTLLHCFEARTGGAAVRLAEAELAEGRWAPAEDPPSPLGADAAALLRLARG